MTQSVQSSSFPAQPLDNISLNNQAGTVPRWLHLMLLPISSHITIGLAKIFNFEVLTHGTSFSNFLSILTHGADPAKGGSGSGKFYTGDATSCAFRDRTKNHFYVFKDSEAKHAKYQLHTGARLNTNNELVNFAEYRDEQGNIRAQQEYRELSIIERIEMFLAPRFHAALSAIGNLSTEDIAIFNIAKQVFYGIGNFLFSPTLRFIYTLEDTQKIFHDDPDYAGKAYRTPHALSNDRIGLVGVCKHASIEGIQEGLSTRPMRVLSGVVHLVAGTFFTAVGAGFFT